MWGRVHSLLLLGLALLKTLAYRALPRRDAVRAFNRVYQVDGVLSVTVEEARVLQSARSCIACGRCDASEGPYVARSRVGYRGMMAFALAGPRDLTRAVASAHTIRDVTEARLERAQLGCPVNVPFVDLARLIRGHAARLSPGEAGVAAQDTNCSRGEAA